MGYKMLDNVRRQAQLEQEHRDRELALRLAMEDQNAVEDISLPPPLPRFGCLALCALSASFVLECAVIDLVSDKYAGNIHILGWGDSKEFIFILCLQLLECVDLYLTLPSLPEFSVIVVNGRHLHTVCMLTWLGKNVVRNSLLPFCLPGSVSISSLHCLCLLC